ncbi:MAG: hypothetical protein GY841_13660 [FCB group bacterium]|nr:hypothetical protein [FCB group bacterium]
MEFASKLSMTVAFDIASYPFFKHGDLFYPAVASILAIINCGGKAVIFSSTGKVSSREKLLIEKLTDSFNGKIIFSMDDGGADMHIS